MSKLIVAIAIVFLFVVPVNAVEITAPTVPESGRKLMPHQTESFGESVAEIIHDLLPLIRPDLAEAAQICAVLISAAMVVSVLQLSPGNTKVIAELAGTAAVAEIFINSGNSMIQLGIRTVEELSEYGKLLLPVLTAALAAQGGVSSATGLYMGTAVFDSLLSLFHVRILVPLLYIYLCVSVAHAAIGEEALKKIKEMIKSGVTWFLKTSLSVFMAYMSITGAVSGTADAAALKMTRVAISTVVPVIGGIMSEASETVLVGAGLVKNSIGIYGVLAVLAVFLNPFIRLGTHYISLKVTGAACSVFGAKRISDLITDFSTVMGFLLAMTGAMCLFLMVSCICFLKGAA